MSCDHMNGREDTKYGGFLTLILYSLRAGVRSFHEGGVGKRGRVELQKRTKKQLGTQFLSTKGYSDPEAEPDEQPNK